MITEVGLLSYGLSLAIGILVITIIDRLWFDEDYKKIEKGYEVLEHYHYTFPLMIVGFLIFESSPVLTFGLIGAGLTFMYREIRQKNYFAFKSTHFKGSSIIGVIGLIATIVVYGFTSF